MQVTTAVALITTGRVVANALAVTLLGLIGLLIYWGTLSLRDADWPGRSRSLREVLNSLAAARQTAHVVVSRGLSRADLYVVTGKLQHAELGRFSGDAAAQRALGWAPTSTRVGVVMGDMTPAVGSIAATVEELVARARRARPPSPWTMLDAVIVTAGTVIIAGTWFPFVYSAQHSLPGAISVLAAGAVPYLLIGVLVYSRMRTRSAALKDLAVTVPSPDWWFYVVPGVVVGIVLTTLAATATTVVQPADTSQCQVFHAIWAASPVASIAVVCVMAPVIEEFVFRGVVLTWLRAHHGPVAALALSALIFGVAHAPVYGLAAGAGTAGAAIAFGSLRLGSGSLLPGMAAHALLNLYSLHGAVSAPC